MNTPGDIWKMVLSLLEKRLQPVTLDAWFDDLTAVEFKDDTLLLHTPDKFKKERRKNENHNKIYNGKQGNENYCQFSVCQRAFSFQR